MDEQSRLSLAPANVLALVIQAYLDMLVDRDAVTAEGRYQQARAAGVDPVPCASEEWGWAEIKSRQNLIGKPEIHRRQR